jgi:hypothetical protein
MDDRNAPATKTDLAEAETRLTEVMREMQTEVLNAFSGCVEVVEIRLNERDATYSSFGECLTVLERRVLNIEKRLNMPPAA